MQNKPVAQRNIQEKYTKHLITTGHSVLGGGHKTGSAKSLACV